MPGYVLFGIETLLFRVGLESFLASPNAVG